MQRLDTFHVRIQWINFHQIWRQNPLIRLIYLTSDSVYTGHVWDRFYLFSIVVMCSKPMLGVAVKVSFVFMLCCAGIRLVRDWSHIQRVPPSTKLTIQKYIKRNTIGNYALSVPLLFCINGLKGGCIDQSYRCIDQSYTIHTWNEAQTLTT